jgi:quinol monooxygenase YgiN
VRGPIADPEKAIELFKAVDAKAVGDARKAGILSHELFIKLARPGEPLELLGIDVWCDHAGMTAHYSNEAHMKALSGAFTGAPSASIWEQAAGNWSEW